MAVAYKCDICGEEVANINNDAASFDFSFSDMSFKLEVSKKDEYRGSCKAIICKPCNAKFTKAVATALNEMYNESEVK